MKKLPLGWMAGLLIGSLLVCPALYLTVGPKLDALQWETLKILLIIALISALWCFVVGQLSGNNSQMDKLWSILPEVYLWIIAARSGFHLRLVLMALLATLWGIRLTWNFARKGAYKLRFWEGEEDYRWAVLRGKKEFQPGWKWALFNLFFISLYQNLLILATTLPGLISMSSERSLTLMDGLAALLVLIFLGIETAADEQQWHFQTTKYRLLGEGKTLEELPLPYSRGFNTEKLWAYSRHPNYLGEQGIWCSMYLFSVAAGIGVCNWSLIGALLLIMLFLGSSSFAEEISSSKYPEYARYQENVSRFFIGKSYQPESVLKEKMS